MENIELLLSLILAAISAMLVLFANFSILMLTSKGYDKSYLWFFDRMLIGSRVWFGGTVTIAIWAAIHALAT